MITIDFVKIVARKYPDLRRSLKSAHIKSTPEKFTKRAFLVAAYISLALSALFFFLFSKQIGFGKVIIFLPLIFTVAFFFSFLFVMETPKGMMRKRQREIDKDVLFAGRYILVKIESGTPLFNTLIDASKTYGVAGKYFREIVDDIETGMPIELALENARQYNTSERFKKILWQLIATLKTGTDVSNALRSTLKVIAGQQLIEIKEYGKKLNSIVLFYMVIACVAPSLGVTLFILVASFLRLDISALHVFAVLFFLAVVQVFFIVLIKASRPMVDI